MRDKLVQFLTEARGLFLTGARQRIAPLNQERPMSLALSSKLMNTEFVRRLNEFAVSNLLKGKREKGLWCFMPLLV